jgi:hypothetical protein
MDLFHAPMLGELLFTGNDYATLQNFVEDFLSPAELEGWKASASIPGALQAGINYYRALFDQATGR